MPIPSTIADLSTTAASNSPAGSDPPTEGDNYLRAIQAILKTADNDRIAADASYSGLLAATAGASLMGWIQAGTGAVASTVQAKLRQIVSITDFGGASGTGNNTAAMDAAEAYLATLGGGIILIPTPGPWLMNWVCTTSNIHVIGAGGRGEYDQYVIRPYSTASAPITFGDGSTEVRYCSISRCHISGTDGTAGAVRTATGNAPQAIRVRGGVIDLHLDECVVYNGIQNLSLEPTDEGASITGFIASRCHFRSDLAGVTTARNFYLARYEHNVDSPDLGYLTSVTFSSCRVNGPKNTDNNGDPTTALPSGAGVAGGYVLETEVFGNVGITVSITGESYWDCAAAAGIFLDVGCQVVGEYQLDPGGSGRSIIKNNESSLNPSRFVVGRMRHGGQLFENGSGSTTAIPAEADTFAYKPLFTEPFVIGPVRWTPATNPYNTSTAPYEDTASTTGPILTYQSGRGLETANGSRWVWDEITEEITLSTSGATTNSATNMLPDNAIIEAVTWRVTQAITTAANFSIGDPTTAARFVSGSTGITLGSTGVGLAHVDQTGAAGPKQTTGNNIRITCNATPGAGKIRVTSYYRTFRVPQS